MLTHLEQTPTAELFRSLQLILQRVMGKVLPLVSEFLTLLLRRLKPETGPKMQSQTIQMFYFILFFNGNGSTQASNADQMGGNPETSK